MPSLEFTVPCQTGEQREMPRTPGEHAMRLVPSAFSAIGSGAKTVEMRLYDTKRQAIKAGDRVTFTQTVTGETLTVTVTGMRVYPDFSALYAAEDPISLGYRPGEKASPDDMSAYYTPEQVTRWGALAMEVSLLSGEHNTPGGKEKETST